MRTRNVCPGSGTWTMRLSRKNSDPVIGIGSCLCASSPGLKFTSPVTRPWLCRSACETAAESGVALKKQGLTIQLNGSGARCFVLHFGTETALVRAQGTGKKALLYLTKPLCFKAFSLSQVVECSVAVLCLSDPQPLAKNQDINQSIKALPHHASSSHS